MVLGKRIKLFVLFILGALLLAKPVFASTTDGTISSGDAWSEKIGWLNFAASHGSVHITDSGLTGYVWSRNYGWIKLNPTKSGVTNNAEGVLSGSAWGENIGWINFSGVTINANGVFTGSASGDNTGVINFSCTHCLVQTDWRPASSRTGSTGGTTGGSALPATIPSPPPAVIPSVTTSIVVPPSSTISIRTTSVSITPISTVGKIINTVKTIVGAALSVINPVNLAINFNTALAKIYPVKLITNINLALSAIEPIKLVVNFNTALSAIYPIKLTGLTPIAKLYSEIQLWVPTWFKAPPIENKIPVESFVAKQTPAALKGVWKYAGTASVNKFVFAPLPKEFLALEKQFPQVKTILQKVGVNRLNDLDKLKSVQMYLPGLTHAVAFNNPEIKTSQFGAEKAIPLGELPQNIKDKIPTNIVFARAAGQLVDFKIAMSLTAQNRPEQKISTVSGKSLQLTVKPDFPAKRIRGYLVFRSKTPQARLEMPLADLINSLFFAEPAFAYTQDQPVPVEEKLVLLTFDYTDPDGDGIYTADIQSPIPSGEYEIITVIDYKDPDLGSKQIRLITVVDPEGYVYEEINGKELRIPNASVTLYHLNTISNSYEQWPAKDFQQSNPQITDVRGSYSFLVTGGTYYIKVEAPGYAAYKGDPFTVDEGGGVHLNIELKSKYWWLNSFDWKTTLLILVAMLLLFNFYKDKIRDRRETKLPIK